MPLSRQDLPRIVEAIQELHRIIADPPAENWQAPTWLVEQYKQTTAGEVGVSEKPSHAWLIDTAAVEVLNRLMQPWHHRKPDCPEITESLLDQRHKVQLIELRNLLLSFALGQRLVDNRSDALQIIAFLESVLEQLNTEPSAGTGAPRIQGPFHTRMRDGSSTLFDPLAAGVKYIGSITNTAQNVPVVGGRPEWGLELALYEAPGPRYIQLSWGGPRTGRSFQGKEVDPAEAAAEFIRDGLPVPPDLALPKEALSAIQADAPHDPGGAGQGERLAKKPKRSTARGEGRAKLIAALTAHHQYKDGGCLNTGQIGVNELARQAEVAPSTASAFFEKEFKGHDRYRALCVRCASELAAALKLLNDEYSPHHLYGANPPGEREGDND
jgi:hypothetical protein